MNKTYRIEFNRNKGYKNEVAYVTDISPILAIRRCRSNHGRDITIKEISEIINLKNLEIEC